MLIYVKSPLVQVYYRQYRYTTVSTGILQVVQVLWILCHGCLVYDRYYRQRKCLRKLLQISWICYLVALSWPTLGRSRSRLLPERSTGSSPGKTCHNKLKQCCQAENQTKKSQNQTFIRPYFYQKSDQKPTQTRYLEIKIRLVFKLNSGVWQIDFFFENIPYLGNFLSNFLLCGEG